MIRFFGAEDFLTRFAGVRQCTLVGGYGTGKSSLAVALAYLLLREGMVDACISTMPISFAMPMRFAPFSNFVAV